MTQPVVDSKPFYHVDIMFKRDNTSQISQYLEDMLKDGYELISVDDNVFFFKRIF